MGNYPESTYANASSNLMIHNGDGGEYGFADAGVLMASPIPITAAGFP